MPADGAAGVDEAVLIGLPSSAARRKLSYFGGRNGVGQLSGYGTQGGAAAQAEEETYEVEEKNTDKALPS